VLERRTLTIACGGLEQLKGEKELHRKMRLTRFELIVMNVVWEKGQCLIRDIHEVLSSRGRPAYTTVQTIIGRLERQGTVRRVRKVGNANMYEATISRKEAQRSYLIEFLDLFGNSAQPIMAQLVEAGQLSLADIRELEKTLTEQEPVELAADRRH
jgi:BlaI family transcriptional regulator, penicillinase repressor